MEELPSHTAHRCFYVFDLILPVLVPALSSLMVQMIIVPIDQLRDRHDLIAFF